MERLTEKGFHNSFSYLKCSESCNLVGVDCMGCPAFENVVNRLAAYEDIGLSPEELSDRARWIPCDEKLPENGEAVLCWYEYYRYGSYNRMFKTHGIGFQFNGNWGGEVAQGKNAKPLFWMPLPDPPKVEKQ